MIPFASIEPGLASFVKAKLSLAEAAVLWANQNAGEPDTSIHTWVSLSRGDLVPLSAVDGVQAYMTQGQPEGQEVTLQAQGVRQLPISVQAFSRGTTTGNLSAFALLSQLATLCRLPSSEATFLGLGLGLLRVRPVRSLDALGDQRIQGRAILELLFNVVDTEEERTTYIGRVQGQLSAEPQPIDFDTGEEPDEE